ncbi:MAG: hypothetical protein ACRENP_09475 [Longimicrobiales bacterium]
MAEMRIAYVADRLDARLPHERSPWLVTTSGATGSVKDGQPVPDSNFVAESNSTVSQQTHAYRPVPNPANSLACAGCHPLGLAGNAGTHITNTP